MVVEETNKGGTHAPYVGNIPAGMNVHGPGNPEQGMGTWARKGQGSLLEGAVLSGVLQNEFTRQTRKSQAEGTACPKAWGLSLDCKALGMAGAQGMCGGGQEEHRAGKGSW